MKWIPSSPITSSIQPRLNINDYRRDYKFDFIKGDIVLNEYVKGLDAFIQKFTKVILTNETPIIKYGLLELVPKSKIQDNFNNECITFANAIVNHKFSDSKPTSPNGLGHTVEKIYSIEKTKLDKIDYLVIETKVNGLSEKLTIKVPLVLIQEYLK